MRSSRSSRGDSAANCRQAGEISKRCSRTDVEAAARARRAKRDARKPALPHRGEGKEARGTAQGIRPIRRSAPPYDRADEAGDVYVNDDFGTTRAPRRGRTDISSSPGPHAKGTHPLAQARTGAHAPRLGGAKITDKFALINNLLDKADEIIIGGGSLHF